MKLALSRCVPLLFVFFAATSCAHTLEVTNLDDYEVPFGVTSDGQITLAIKQYSGPPNEVFFFNSIVKNLSSRREVKSIETSSVGSSGPTPDFTLSIDLDVDYQPSGTNFFVNFPGGILFAPAWLGYLYYANIDTTVSITAGDGGTARDLVVETDYSIRHADFGRTWYPIFSFSILNPIGGVFTASVYDTDVTPQFRSAVEQNYADYVTAQILAELQR